MGDWERLAGHLNASPFLWPGWIEAWWNTFGAGRLQILTVRHDGRLTGVLPLRRSGNTLSSTTNNQVPIFGFLAADETAAEKLTQTLFSQDVRRIYLPLLSEDNDFSLTRAAADARRYRVFSESVPGLPYVPVDEMSWEAYEKGLGKNLRGDVRRRRRRLEENGDLKLDIQDGREGLEALLKEGFRVEGSGWKDVEHTSIQSHPATRRFYADVASWAGGRGWLRLAFLRLDGHPLAFDYCLEAGGRHYMLKTGYDPVYSGFSPGKVLRYLMVARAFSEGLSTYELLGGFEPWKEKWTRAHRNLHSLHMFAPTASGFLARTMYAGGRLATRNAKSLAQNPYFPERGYRFLRRVRRAWHR